MRNVELWENKPFQDQCGQEGWKGGYIPFWCLYRLEVEGWGASIFWGFNQGFISGEHQHVNWLHLSYYTQFHCGLSMVPCLFLERTFFHFLLSFIQWVGKQLLWSVQYEIVFSGYVVGGISWLLPSPFLFGPCDWIFFLPECWCYLAGSSNLGYCCIPPWPSSSGAVVRSYSGVQNTGFDGVNSSSIVHFPILTHDAVYTQYVKNQVILHWKEKDGDSSELIFTDKAKCCHIS